MKVGYLGPKGSFTHAAAHDYFKRERLISFSSIPACIEGVVRDEVALGVVPIENTIEGTVNLTLDYLFHKVDVSVVGELVMPIAQQLLGKATSLPLAEITQVYSHPQALAQSQEFLATQLPQAELVPTASTSRAAQFVRRSSDPSILAIGPVSSATEYGLEIIVPDIQQLLENKTRFWLISREARMTRPATGRASLCVTLPNNLPGALQKALTTFSWRELNLSKIESRPLKTTLGEYFFLIEVIFRQEQQLLLENAIAEIESLGGTVKAFGVYDVTTVKDF